MYFTRSPPTLSIPILQSCLKQLRMCESKDLAYYNANPSNILSSPPQSYPNCCRANDNVIYACYHQYSHCPHWCYAIDCWVKFGVITAA